MPTVCKRTRTHHDYSVTLELFARFRSEGNERKRLWLRNKIAEQNIGLVQKAARAYAQQSREEFEDLVQIGFFGLLKAIDKFELGLGNKFSSFAMPWIKGAILHHLRDSWGCLKPPREYTEIHSKVNAAHNKLIQQGRSQTIDQTAIGLGLSAEKWAAICKAMGSVLLKSLDESPIDLSADLPDQWGEIERELLLERLSTLDPVAQQCLQDRFVHGLPFEAIAGRRGLSVAGVRLLVGESLDQLRYPSA